MVSGGIRFFKPLGLHVQSLLPGYYQDRTIQPLSPKSVLCELAPKVYSRNCQFYLKDYSEHSGKHEEDFEMPALTGLAK